MIRTPRPSSDATATLHRWRHFENPEIVDAAHPASCEHCREPIIEGLLREDAAEYRLLCDACAEVAGITVDWSSDAECGGASLGHSERG
jgi:formylmethanofuran dehydrogenase subunit E